jgi:hypothetical protein
MGTKGWVKKEGKERRKGGWLVKSRAWLGVELNLSAWRLVEARSRATDIEAKHHDREKPRPEPCGREQRQLWA